MDDDGLPRAADVNLACSCDVQVPQVTLELLVGSLQVKKGLHTGTCDVRTPQHALQQLRSMHVLICCVQSRDDLQRCSQVLDESLGLNSQTAGVHLFAAASPQCVLVSQCWLNGLVKLLSRSVSLALEANTGHPECSNKDASAPGRLTHGDVSSDS